MRIETSHVPPAEIEYEDRGGAICAEPIGECGGGRFVEEPKHLDTGNPCSVECGLSTGVVEVCGYGDDGLGDRLAYCGRGIAEQLLEDSRREFFRAPLAEP